MKTTKNRTILCMKWGDLYSEEYVNVLYLACCDNISGDFRFVCLCDDASGLHPGIEHFPIPEIGLDQWHWYDGVWPKLSLFAKDLYGLQGRCLFIDLDMIICSSLDPFFEYEGEIISTDMGPNWRPNHGTGAPETGTCMFAFDFGQQPQILEKFQADRDLCVDRFKIEQNCVHHFAHGMTYWPPEWVISFKRHLRRPIIIDRLLPPKAPGSKVKIVAFHGDPRPVDLIKTSGKNWSCFPRYGKKPVSWVVEYWQKYSFS